MPLFREPAVAECRHSANTIVAECWLFAKGPRLDSEAKVVFAECLKFGTPKKLTLSICRISRSDAQKKFGIIP